jgi:uncharacterized protein YecT (DUF1311 family)
MCVGNLTLTGSCALAFVLLSLSSVACAQQHQRNNQRPPACDQYDKVPVPVADLPTLKDRQVLASCNSQDLYFGFDHPADPVKARKCAYIERETGKGVPETVFGAAGLLTMIYANGKGAARNFDLALKFACEIDGALAENDYRFKHLLKLKKEHWSGDNFNLCDDATSGFMQGFCAGLQEDFDHAERTRKLSAMTVKWTPAEQTAFRELQKAASAYFEASSRNEVDLSGTGRAAFEIEAEASLNDDFVAAVERFEKGQLPKFMPSDFSKSDAELNSIYSKIQADPHNTVELSTVTPQGIQIAERAWLRYREAWVKFSQLKYPGVTPDSWRTLLTRERIKVLKSLT